MIEYRWFGQGVPTGKWFAAPINPQPWSTGSRSFGFGISYPDFYFGTGSEVSTFSQAGSTEIRVKYVPGTGAPDQKWLAIGSQAFWTSRNGSGQADDGQGNKTSTSTTYPASRSQRRQTIKLVRLKVPAQLPPDGVIYSTTVTTSASANYPRWSPSAGSGVRVWAEITDKRAIIARAGGRGRVVDEVTGKVYNEHEDADGVRKGDTTYTFLPPSGDPSQPGSLLTYNTFIPYWFGTWTKYPDPSWPYDNVKVEWNGLDASYSLSPTYSFDTSNNGVYLSRMAPLPTRGPGNLKLTVTDLGDGTTADADYVLRYHHVVDDWVKKFDRQDVESEEPVQSGLACVPGGKVTLSVAVTKTKSHTCSVNFNGSVQFAGNKAFIEPTLGIDLGYTFQSTFSLQVGASSEFTAPPNAAYCDLVIVWRLTREIGEANGFDADGLTALRSPTTRDTRNLTGILTPIWRTSAGMRL